MANGICILSDCDRVGRLRNGVCTMHYQRMAKHGTYEERPGRGKALPPTVSAKGYRLVYAPGHPLLATRASRGSRLFEHRVVLFAKIGPGQHPCHHCQLVLTWGVDLQADHLDEDRVNNDPDNLVPTCQPCNTKRGKVSVEEFEVWLVGRRLHVAALNDTGIEQLEAS